MASNFNSGRQYEVVAFSVSKSYTRQFCKPPLYTESAGIENESEFGLIQSWVIESMRGGAYL